MTISILDALTPPKYVCWPEQEAHFHMLMNRIYYDKQPRNWMAVSLTLRQGLRRSDRTIQKLTRLEVSKSIKQLMKDLNRAVFGAANRRYAKQLPVVPVIEEKNGRLHVHMLMERPIHFSPDSFRKLIHERWCLQRWAMEEHKIDVLETKDDVERWTLYILKDYIKNRDVVDYANIVLPSNEAPAQPRPKCRSEKYAPRKRKVVVPRPAIPTSVTTNLMELDF